jgi:GntR family transcriptional regulator
LISINYRDSRPIYEQIKDGLKTLMLAGAIAKDEKLPSVRDMAVKMSINPNTIQRAYRELEAEGFIYSVSGKGSFASGRSDLDEKKRAELDGKLKEVIERLLQMGVSAGDITAFVNKCLEERADDQMHRY